MAYDLGIILGDLDNPFFQEQELWYRKYLPESPFNARFYYPRDPGDADEQADLCVRALRDNPDALIVNALDENTLGRAAMAVRSRAALIDAGAKISPALTASLPRYMALLTVDYQEQGRLCAETLAAQTPKLRRFLCIGGPQRARQSSRRVTGALAALAALPRIEKRTVWTDFTREGGAAAMEQMLDWLPDAVFCADDTLALGALDTLLRHGLKTPVGGVDLIPSAVFSVKTGGLACSVGVDGGQLVRGTLHAADAFLTSGTVPNGYLVSNRVVSLRELRIERRRRRVV